MKKLIALLLSAACCVTMGGCWFSVNFKNSQQSSEAETETATQPVTGRDIPDVPVGEKIDATEPDVSPDYEILSKYNLDADIYGRKPHTFDETLKNTDENNLYITDRMYNSFDYFTTIEAVYVKRENLTVSLCCYLADRQTGKAKEIVFKVDEESKHITPSQYVCVDSGYHYTGVFTEESAQKYGFDYADLNSDAVINTVRKLLHTPLLAEVKKLTEKPKKNLSEEQDDDIVKSVDVYRLLKQELPVSSDSDLRYYAYIPRNNIIGLVNTREHYNPWYFYAYKISAGSGLSFKVSDNEIEISGKYSDENAHNHTFTAEIEKNTGVMLNRVEKNGSGNVVEEIQTLMIAIDRKIDQNVFDKFVLPND